MPAKKEFGVESEKDRKKNEARLRRKAAGKKVPLIDSFSYAFYGIYTGIRKERNMKLHCLSTVLVFIFGFFFHISALEWCVCFTLIGLIMALELINTSIEAVVDLATEEYHPLAKIAKDTAAGAVLIASIFAAACAAIIFLPKVIVWITAL